MTWLLPRGQLPLETQVRLGLQLRPVSAGLTQHFTHPSGACSALGWHHAWVWVFLVANGSGAQRR